MVRKYPSLFLLSFVVAGIVLADQSQLASGWFLALALVFGFVGLTRAAAPKTGVVAASFAMSLLFLSAFHFAGDIYDTGPRHIAALADPDTRYHIFGRVADWPEFKSDRTEITLALDSVISDRTEEVSGSILLRVTDTTTALQRGDRIEFWGKIYRLRARSESGSFDYGRFLNLRGVFGLVYLPTLLDVRVDRVNRYGIVNAVDRLRSAITESLERNLSPAAAALASGFLIGETRNIPSEIYARFRDSGTLHLLAVSGSNVALVLLFFVYLLKPMRLARLKRSLVLLIVTGLFALLSHGEPSVIRASLMASLVIIAQLMERRYDLNNVISLTALTILLVSPAQLFNVGFQLSFVTAWGLIFLTPPIHGLFKSYHVRRWYRWLVFPLIISVVAQICSAPLIIYYFHRVPLLSVAANLVIVPLVSLAVVGVLALLLADLIWPLLGFLVGSFLTKLLDLTVFLLNIFGREHLPTLSVKNLPAWAVVVIYAFLVGAVPAIRSKPARRRLVFAAVFLAIAALLQGVVHTADREHDYEIHMFSVPGGLAAVVRAGGDKDADLIITDLHRREYQADDVIIIPALEDLRVDRLHSVVVLDADYGALDDIIRLASARKATGLFVNPSLVNSVTDAVAGLDDVLSPAAVRALNPVGHDPLQPGYYPSQAGLWVVLGSCRLLVADEVGPDIQNGSPQSGPTALIVGSELKTGSAELGQLREKGYSPVVCSRVTLPGSGKEGLGERAEQALLPDSIYDLNRLGAFSLAVKGDSLISIPSPIR